MSRRVLPVCRHKLESARQLPLNKETTWEGNAFGQCRIWATAPRAIRTSSSSKRIENWPASLGRARALFQVARAAVVKRYSTKCWLLVTGASTTFAGAAASNPPWLSNWLFGTQSVSLFPTITLTVAPTGRSEGNDRRVVQKYSSSVRRRSID